MSHILPAWLLAIAALSLAACSEKNSNESISIDMNSEDGNVAVSVPGFETKLKVPSGLMGRGNFDIDGVKLYPESKVKSFNLNVGSTTKNDTSTGNAVVKMSFAAPADVATVANWYKAQFAAKSVLATQTATGFSGKTEDGDTFTIALTPGAAGGTNGAIAVADAGN